MGFYGFLTPKANKADPKVAEKLKALEEERSKEEKGAPIVKAHSPLQVALGDAGRLGHHMTERFSWLYRCTKCYLEVYEQDSGPTARIRGGAMTLSCK